MASSTLRGNPARTIFNIVVLFFFPLLGFMLANVLDQASYEGAFVNWHSLGKPSEGVVDIVGGNPWTVWWKAQDGQIYEGDIESCRNVEKGCWRKSKNIDIFYQSREGFACESAFSDIKSPPGSLLKCLTVINIAESWYDEVHYVLLQDGSIWYWKHRLTGGLPGLNFGSHEVIVFGGTLIGLFTGLGAYLYLRNTRKVSSAQ